MASRQSAKSVPVSCTEPDEVCGTKSEECSDLDLASFADSEGNDIMWVPECDDCVKLVGGIGFPRHPSKEMKVSLLKPKFWFSDVIDAFFVSVAHSVTKHSTKVQVLPMCGTYEHQLNSLFERITERDVHYFAPFYDDSAGFHFFLVHFFGDSMIVSDCEMDKNSYLFRDLRKSTTKFLSPVCKRYKKKMGHTLKVSYSTDHFLMSSKKGDQVHCSANVCANLLLSLSLKSSLFLIEKHVHEKVCSVLDEYEDAGGEKRRSIIIDFLEEIMPSAPTKSVPPVASTLSTNGCLPQSISVPCLPEPDDESCCSQDEIMPSAPTKSVPPVASTLSTNDCLPQSIPVPCLPEADDKSCTQDEIMPSAPAKSVPPVASTSSTNYCPTQSIPVPCLPEPDNESSSHGDVDDMDSFVDCKGNKVMWLPDCADCKSIVPHLTFPQHITEATKESLLMPKFWFSDVIDAFVVSVSHSFIHHNPTMKLMRTFSFCQIPIRLLLKMIGESSVHYLLPTYDDSFGSHYFLLHIFCNEIIVIDCKNGSNSEKKRERQNATLKLLSPLAERYAEETGCKPKIVFATAHYLMSETDNDQFHFAANVCANMLSVVLSTTLHLSEEASLFKDVYSIFSGYRDACGKGRRLIIVELLELLLPSIPAISYAPTDKWKSKANDSPPQSISVYSIPMPDENNALSDTLNTHPTITVPSSCLEEVSEINYTEEIIDKQYGPEQRKDDIPNMNNASTISSNNQNNHANLEVVAAQTMEEHHVSVAQNMTSVLFSEHDPVPDVGDGNMTEASNMLDALSKSCQAEECGGMSFVPAAAKTLPSEFRLFQTPSLFNSWTNVSIMGSPLVKPWNNFGSTTGGVTDQQSGLMKSLPKSSPSHTGAKRSEPFVADISHHSESSRLLQSLANSAPSHAGAKRHDPFCDDSSNPTGGQSGLFHSVPKSAPSHTGAKRHDSFHHFDSTHGPDQYRRNYGHLSSSRDRSFNGRSKFMYNNTTPPNTNDYRKSRWGNLDYERHNSHLRRYCPSNNYYGPCVDRRNGRADYSFIDDEDMSIATTSVDHPENATGAVKYNALNVSGISFNEGLHENVCEESSFSSGGNKKRSRHQRLNGNPSYHSNDSGVSASPQAKATFANNDLDREVRSQYFFSYMDMKESRPVRDVLGRATQKFSPSHNATGNLIEKCLPHKVGLQFVQYFEDVLVGYVDHQKNIYKRQ